jgi:aspartyl-tRNA(Asn)/glutamyl-tRNA(Gln) amidotransferase subunit A
LDLIEHCLQRIERGEPHLRAWVLVDAPGARRLATQLDAEARGGSFRGPLHGIPLGIKDIVDVAGWPTRAGSTITSADPVAEDAPLVRSLRNAGAVLLGKTVTTEFACFDPAETRNPWNLDHTPGGSSSGSATAVAAGMCLGAIGTQTGGSIVRPASYCGISGFKPTWGRLPLEGIVPVSFHLDHAGPLARCVADLALMFEAMQPAEQDNTRRVARPETTPSDRQSASDRMSALHYGDAPRLAVIGPYFMDEADPATRAMIGQAIEKLKRAGAQVEDLDLQESFVEVQRMHRRIMAVEAAWSHRANFPARRNDYGPNLAGLLDEGLKTPTPDYVEALAYRLEFQSAMVKSFGHYDAWLTPATPGTAPRDLGTTGDPRFNAPWSFAGLPTVSLPCGLDGSGLPAALQLIGRSDDDQALLDVAQWCEPVLGFEARPRAALD